jgi:hypothetical protein
MCDGLITYYSDIIDQFTLGHQFLLSEFDVVPSIAWQLDPFGHSGVYPSLLSEMGFQGVFLARVSDTDRVRFWMEIET